MTKTITKQIEVYSFDELSKDAKRNVSQWVHQYGYFWMEESVQSVKSFCDEFGVKVKNYEIGLWGHSYINTDAENNHFRGFTKAQAMAMREKMPTGYCLDCTLFYTFADNFDKGALVAFNDAIDAAVKDILSDMESQESDEYLSEHCEANSYEFDVNGKIV